MKTRLVWISLCVCFACLIAPSLLVAKGYMGGRGNIIVEEPPTDTGGNNGVPDTVDGPLNDKKSDAGKLFGDLYIILRQQGKDGETKLIATEDGQFEVSSTVVGGEPVLTVIDPPSNTTDTIDYQDMIDYGWYVKETEATDGTIIFTAEQASEPALCVQPIANYERWGDISSKTGLSRNRLPLVITYDPTWNRSECEVGQLISVAPTNDGELDLEVNEYFIEPCDRDDAGNVSATEKCQWWDTTNDLVTYPDGVLWTELIGEVHFGRLNLSRAPEAVLQAAFDEAINTINSDETTAIEIDASGRLLMTKNVYDELLVDPDTGEPLWIGEVQKAIDSPLENMALYLKLMQDGHLVTPAEERIPIDRSKNGGIPLWKLLELEDGPADAALRPTIDIDKMKRWGLGNLVIASPTDYYTFYVCTDSAGNEVDCLVWDNDPLQPELVGEWVANPEAVNRSISTTQSLTECPYVVDHDGYPVVNDDGSYQYICEGPFTGLVSHIGQPLSTEDFRFAAAFLAAAADKTGDISVDMLVYLNSILGINTVLGFSSYDEDGNPTSDAIDYSKNPIYYDFRSVTGYNRDSTFNQRGERVAKGGLYTASTYSGKVLALQGGTPSWTETSVDILSAEMNEATIFDNIDLNLSDSLPNYQQAAANILGFTQQADDDLSVINFIHTYQIPERR